MDVGRVLLPDPETIAMQTVWRWGRLASGLLGQRAGQGHLPAWTPAPGARGHVSARPTPVTVPSCRLTGPQHEKQHGEELTFKTEGKEDLS